MMPVFTHAAETTRHRPVEALSLETETLTPHAASVGHDHAHTATHKSLAWYAQQYFDWETH